MKIIKTEEEITSQRISKTITIEINNKEVRVDYWFTDSDLEGYDNDYEINEEDLKELTEKENEILEDYLDEMIKCEVGHFIDIPNK